jgi:hypothetical protein
MARHLNLSILRSFKILVCAVSFCSTLVGVAQTTTPHSRINATIDNSRRAELAGTRSPRAVSSDDLGAVAPDLQLKGISLILSRSQDQQTDLDQLAAAQHNPASPLYHQWLTPAQYAARFGVADTDIAAAEAWLESEGFSVDSVSKSRNRVLFSGTAAQVADAFGSPLHYYKAKAETTSHFAPSTSLFIPAALASVVQSVGNLSSYRPHSHAVVASLKPQPHFTVGGNQLVYLTPLDVATIYDVNPAYSSGYNGLGQTIAIAGQSAVVATDLANFQTALGVPVKPQSLNLVPGTGASAVVSGDEVESDLDLEYASAMAPGAAVSLYYVGNSGTSDAFDAAVYVIDNDLAQVISLSYGSCEPDLGQSLIQSFDAAFEQAAVQGETIVVAAGDEGSTDCANTPGSTSVQQSIAVDYPASSPWVVGMGGTQFPAADVAGDPINTTYWGPAPNNDVVSTALSYIPEQVWNDTGSGFISTGGGGISIYEPRPAWQTGLPGIGEGSWRLVPDISLAASDQAPGFLMCSSDNAFWDNSGEDITGSCTNGFRDAAATRFNVIGGTSVTAPIFAGLVAVLNQAKGYTAGQGLINSTIYNLASNPTTYASGFHDITSGGNNCTSSASCGTGPQNTDYLAGVGYDEASGLGSIDFNNLLSAWPESTGAGAVTTTTTLSASTASAVFGSIVTFTAAVSGGTGTVTFLEGATTLGVGQVNGFGVATLSLSTLPYGNNSVTASYGGTTGFSTSTSTAVIVNVTGIPSTTRLSASSLSPTYGASVTLTATVSANGSPGTSGVVTFLDGATSLGSGTVNSNGVAMISSSTLPSGADSITASYAGTQSLAASVSTPVTVTVAPETSTTSLTVATPTPVFGSSVALTATVSANGSPATSGVVTFLDGATSLGTGTVNSNGVATISPSTLPTGANSITASFAGTSSFSASVSSPVTVTVEAATTTTTLTASSTTPAFGASVAFTATVSASGSPATSGVVTFLDGVTAFGTGTVNSNGVATISVSTLPGGADRITASYAGTSSFVASLSSPVTVTVAPEITTTSLTASPINPAFGSNVTLTATVSANGATATSGVVTFVGGSTALGTGAVNSNGVATLSTSALPSGANSMTASFAGTSSYAASVSSPVMVTVAPETTTTTINASSTTPSFGSSVAFTATVSANGGPATSGMVTFLNGATAIGTGTVNSAGMATISLSTLPSGANSITASFAGTQSFAGSVSPPVTVLVARTTTTTSLTVATTNPAFGASVAITATVSANGNPATSGVVTFIDGATAIGTGTVNSNGVATISLSTLPSGADSITARYAGTQSFAASVSNPVTVTVAPATTTTVLTVSSTTPSFGSGVAFTATISANGSQATSGVVTFLNGATAIGTGTVNSNGVATISLSSLPSGANSITASFAGTQSFAASVSNPVTVTVALATTTTVLTASATNPAFGSNVALTATVTAKAGPAASGVVTFLDGATALGTGTVNSSGVATISRSTLPSGADSITASYAGTQSFAASVSSPVTVTVAQATTTTSLTASPTNPAFGSTVVFTATVSANGGTATSGVVTFLDGATALGTGTVNSNGVATISLSTLPSGVATITASYGGAGSFAASASNPVTVTIAAPVAAATATALSASLANVTSGDPVTFTAAVTSGGAPVSTGVVTFLNGGNTLGTGTVNSTGVATISLSTLPVGADSISAQFGGTSSFATSVSGVVMVTVSVAITPAPIAITIPTLPAVSPGGSTTSSVSFTASSSYSGTMNLSCTLTSSPTGAQYVPTCSLNPTTLTFTASSVGTSTLTVATTSTTTTTALPHSTSGTPWGLAGASAMAGLLMFCLPARRRRMMSMLLLLLVVTCIGAVGCGGGGGTSVAPPGSTTQQTTAGSYTFSVKGTDASNPNLTNSATVTVTVE